MNCSYNLTESEVVKAMQLHGEGSRIILWILGITGVALAVAGTVSEYRIVLWGALICGIIGYFSTLFISIPRNAKNQFKQNRALRNEISMEVSAQGINFKSASGESKLIWSDIHKWKQGNGLYLLYITNTMFHMVPARALENHELLLRTLVEKIGPANA